MVSVEALLHPPPQSLDADALAKLDRAIQSQHKSLVTDDDQSDSWRNAAQAISIAKAKTVRQITLELSLRFPLSSDHEVSFSLWSENIRQAAGS